MADRKTPLTISGIKESIYAGFWTRLCSLLLDILFIAPWGLFVFFINGLSKNAHYFTLIPGLIFHFWFSIYLVKKYGGTPGKLIVGIKILKLDGTEVTWREAILRESISFILTILFSLMSVYAITIADWEYYKNLGWIHKQQYLFALTPILYNIYSWTSNVWDYSELFVLLFNKRKRALHDFIADTVIVKTKYIDKIREVINADQTPVSVDNEENAST